jgi:hypothetical protein
MRPSKLRFLFVYVFFGAFMNMINPASAQGIERESLSGENVADELRQSGVNQPYNLQLGPVTIRAEADGTASFNDNIGLNKTGRMTDLILTPSAILDAQWKVSDLNTISLVLGIGYETYVFHSQYNSLLLSPDSEAQFNFFVGDVIFTLHDGFSYQQDPTAVGQLSNTTRLSRWQNDAGIGAKWDLNDIILSLNYDHANLWVTQSIYDYLTNQSDTLTPKLTVKVDQSIDTGLILSVSSVRYEQSFENDYKTLSVGPFVSATISDNLSVNAQAGGYFADYATGGGNGDSENVSSFYGSAAVNHRVNDSINETATVGREFIPGLTSNFTQRIYANYTATWQATTEISLGGNLLWENLDDSDAAFREDSNRYGAGLSVFDTLNQKVTLSFNYQYLIKDASPSDLSYYQNTATVGLRYQF